MSRLPAAAIVAVYALLASSSFAQAPDAAKATVPAPQPANDYAKAENWLCRPDRDDACSADLTTTVVAASRRAWTGRYAAAMTRTTTIVGVGALLFGLGCGGASTEPATTDVTTPSPQF